MCVCLCVFVCVCVCVCVVVLLLVVQSVLLSPSLTVIGLDLEHMNQSFDALHLTPLRCQILQLATHNQTFIIDLNLLAEEAATVTSTVIATAATTTTATHREQQLQAVVEAAAALSGASDVHSVHSLCVRLSSLLLCVFIS